MLELRPSCEHCDAELPPGALHARICTYECTFCADCARDLLGEVCPNCSGELVARPLRPAALLDADRPSTTRTHQPVDLDAQRAMRAQRPIDGDHPGVVLRRYADAWRASDLEGVLACYAPDFTVHYAGSSDLAGDHVGRDAAVAAMVSASQRAVRTLVSIDDVLVSDSGGALVVTESLARDGETATLTRVLRYRVTDGMLRECWLLDAQQDVVDHFWRASEPGV